MPEMERETRADRWAQSMSADMERAAWERRQEEHWQRLHKQLYWLPCYFIVWSLAVGIGAAVLGVLFGVSLAGLAR
jgi:hypothetical protein